MPTSNAAVIVTVIPKEERDAEKLRKIIFNLIDKSVPAIASMEAHVEPKGTRTTKELKKELAECREELDDSGTWINAAGDE